MCRRLSLTGLLLAAASNAVAVDRDWNAQSGGSFGTGSNWVGGIVPGAGDVAVFDFAVERGVPFQTPYTVSFSTNPTNQAVRITSNVVAFDLNGRIYALTTATPITIGTSALAGGRLTIADGTVAANADSVMTLGAGGAGFLTVTTGGLLAGSLMDITMGGARGATLSVNGGGDVIADAVTIGNNASSSSSATFTGASSSMSSGTLTVASLGTGTLTINSSGQVDSTRGIVGGLAGSTGTVNIGAAVADGTTSRWRMSGPLTVGNAGKGVLNINHGGRVENTDAELGVSSSLIQPVGGEANVTGATAQWINSGRLDVGNGGTAFLTVSAGGRVESASGNVGRQATSDALGLISGANSLWKMTGNLRVGEAGRGNLSVNSGGALESGSAEIGVQSGSNGLVSLIGGRWTNSGKLTVGSVGVGELRITSSEVSNTDVFFGDGLNGSGKVTVAGSSSKWISSGQLNFGTGVSGEGMVDVTGGALMQSASAVLGSASGGLGTVNLDGSVPGAKSRWINTGTLTIGNTGIGMISVTNGALLQVNGATTIGKFADPGLSPGGTVTVSGSGSTWTNGSVLAVGASSPGIVSIRDGGALITASARIGGEAAPATGGIGVVTVEGEGSTWTNSGNVALGGNGDFLTGQGTLNINFGATINIGGTLNHQKDGTLTITGGELNAAGINFVTPPGGSSTGTFRLIAGTVRFTSSTTFNSILLDKILGPVHSVTPLKHLAVTGTATLATPLILDGGTLSVGQFVNGSLFRLERGTLNVTGQPVAIEAGGLLGDTLDVASDTAVNVSMGLTNRGLVTGDGRVGGGAFQNDAAGELRAEPGRSLTLTGAGNTNGGRISLFGGLLEFTQGLTNNAGGTVSGNGTLRAGGGLVNHGSMNFSGLTNVVGDVTNGAGGKIVSSGGGPLTFYDDVTNDGEIRTSQGSHTVFFGQVTGNGQFTGTGTKTFEGGTAAFSLPIASGGSINVEAAASLSAPLLRENVLTVRGAMTATPGGGVSTLSSLVMDGGTFDLSDNAVVVRSGDVSELHDLIASARNAPGGNWTGPGITTSADADGLHTLSLVPNASLKASSFRGVALNPTDLIIAFGLVGDGNLDGAITSDDYHRIDSGFLQRAEVYHRGDFNYDGRVDLSDYALIDAAFLAQSVTTVTVPEPGSLLVPLAAMLRGRRRNRNKESQRRIDARTGSGVGTCPHSGHRSGVARRS